MTQRQAWTEHVAERRHELGSQPRRGAERIHPGECRSGGELVVHPLALGAGKTLFEGGNVDLPLKLTKS
jgi:hypothetical protein